MSRGVVLDAGAFLGLERRSPRMMEFFDKARKSQLPLATSAAVIGQVWRGSNRQAPIAMALKWPNTDVLPLTHGEGLAVGKMLAVSGRTDVIDAHVALLAHHRGWPVLTSDPDDLHALNPKLTIWSV